MILQCPNCSTRFNVPDGAIPPEGRKVKCANCETKWHATPDQAVREEPAAPLPRKRRPQGGAGVKRAGAPRLGQTQPGQSRPVRRQPRPEPRYEPEFETPDDLQRDAGLAAQHMSIRRQLVDTNTPQESGIADDIDPFAGIDDDPITETMPPRSDTKRMPTRAPKPAIDEVTEEEDDTLDFMAKVASGAGDKANTLDTVSGALDGFATKGRSLLNGASIGKLKPSIPSLSSFSSLLLRVAWGGLAVFWLTLISMVLVFGETLQAIWPPSSQIYSALTSVSDVERIRANADQLSAPITDAPQKLEVGLNEADGLPYAWDTRDGVNYLTLNLVVRNDGKLAASVPKVQIVFLDKNNKAIGSWQADPPGRILTRGSFLTFTVSRSDYPSGIAKVVASAIEGSKSEREAELP